MLQQPSIDDSGTRDRFPELIYGYGQRHFTQDSPILPNVWERFTVRTAAPPKLLLTPHRQSSAADLASAVTERASMLGASIRAPVYNDTYVVGTFAFEEMINILLPLTNWFHTLVLPKRDSGEVRDVQDMRDELAFAVAESPRSEMSVGRRGHRPPPDLVWLTRLVGWIVGQRRGDTSADLHNNGSLLTDYFLAAAESAFKNPIGPPWPLWLVNINREAGLAVSRSRRTVKADVTEHTFRLDYDGIHWAVLDSGIDAQHPAFRKRGNGNRMEPDWNSPWGHATRVVATYDFTDLPDLLAASPGDPVFDTLPLNKQIDLQAVQFAFNQKRPLPWDILRSLLEITHDGTYRPPVDEHGTHVAGILAADWRLGDDADMPEAEDLLGVCPGLHLYDLRVIKDNGTGDEFSINTALQFLRYLNSLSDQMIIHGANLSITVPTDYANYAAGRTPVCDECERLVGSGVVTVVAAGNLGHQNYVTTQGGIVSSTPGFNDISIADPGNAEAVITVGSTHRRHPHSYGVSYFSSRGPTADGRAKPDIVAPGEKIIGPVPGRGTKAMDGTSMATPHVSGAAAALMARHRELIGQPVRIKRILTETATELGRVRYFQGAGLLDVFRAMQSV